MPYFSTFKRLISFYDPPYYGSGATYDLALESFMQQIHRENVEEFKRDPAKFPALKKHLQDCEDKDNRKDGA